jgi:2-polyprenyl-3-methyl-5-hydroxy-6-metoxy-1,4-benzoquinol methylase
MAAAAAFAQTLNSQWPSDGLEHVRKCPVCGDPRRHQELDDIEDTAFRAAPGKWCLQRCDRCRSAYLDPRPDRRSIALAYRNYYTHAAVPAQPSTLSQRLRRAIANGYRNHLFATQLRPTFPLAPLIAPLFTVTAARIRLEARGLERLRVKNGRVLDVGCGDGALVELAGQMGWHCFGVEFDDIAATAARRRGIEVLAAEVSDIDPRYDSFFDAITLSHVIEHMHDPLATLRHCRRVIKPGGYLWLQTPNIDSAGYEIYGRFWRGLESPRHLALFTPRSLREILKEAGFARITMLEPENVIGPVFAMSALMEAGYPVGVDAQQPLDAANRRKLEIAISRGRAIAQKNPERAEFIGIVAFRPDA